MTQRKGRYPESSVPGDRQDTFGVRDVIASYDIGTPALVAEYESLSFEEIHGSVLDLLPESTGCILDVGAGTGRDAAWFAANGHNVVAVEPSAQFRAAGQERHRSPDIRWMNDTLPALEKVLRSKLTFDLVWVSAVWMHVPRSVRARAFRKLVYEYLRSNGAGWYQAYEAAFRSSEQQVAETIIAVTGDALGDILLYHVAPGAVPFAVAKTVDDLPLPMLNGDTVVVDGVRDRWVKLTDGAGRRSWVNQPDIFGSNGVIHKINRVLLPFELP